MMIRILLGALGVALIVAPIEAQTPSAGTVGRGRYPCPHFSKAGAVGSVESGYQSA
jgi:hypothetical protein